jgi:hypothetical protein
MSNILRTAAVIGLLFPLGGRAQETGRGVPGQPVEICEALPWDVPAEQSLTVESVLRWRHGVRLEEKSAQQPAQAVAETSIGRPVGATLDGQARQIGRTSEPTANGKLFR